MKYNQNIPQGTRDILFGEASLYSDITERFSDVFKNSGFRQVRTPNIEFYDVFACDQSLKQESMYKLSDMSGRLIALRADNTTPMARVAVTKLKSCGLPVKLFYNQNTYRINSGWSGRRNEILQNGVEIIGSTGIKSDLICILTAIYALETLGIDYKIEIGNVGYYNAMIKQLGLNEEETQLVRRYVEQKNLGKVQGYGKIGRIPLLYGGKEVFAEANELASGVNDALASLDYVRHLYDLLDKAGYSHRIIIDMGIVHDIDYYTGMVFRGYLEGAGEPVLTGGRYDNLLRMFGEDIPATGFAINIGIAADTIIKMRGIPDEKVPEYIIYFNEDDILSAELFCKNNGSCEYSCHASFEETAAYAKIRKIKHAIEISGGKVVRDIICIGEVN